MEKFIGSLVSLDCGETLGTYQGQVIAINPVEGSITIVNAYRNGVPFKSPQVTLRSLDIKDLTIVKSSDEAKELQIGTNKHISLITTSNNTYSLLVNNTKLPSVDTNSRLASSNGSTCRSENQQANSCFWTLKASDSGCPKSKPAATELPTTSQGNGYKVPPQLDGLAQCLDKLGIIDRSQISSGSCRVVPDNRNYHHHPVVTSSSFADINGFFSSAAGFQHGARKRTSSASEVPCVQQNRKALTPRKTERLLHQTKINNECFNDANEVFDDDFDFDKNLALFDKQAVFEEIEKELDNGSGCGRNSQTNRKKKKVPTATLR